jgi:hypothetical protein
MAFYSQALSYYATSFECEKGLFRAQIHLSLHHSSHFIAPLTFHDIISINILGFHLIVLHFIHFSIKKEFVIKC